jgi:hypothetical protein
VDETGGLLLGEAVDGDPGPLGQDLGDLLLVDDPAGVAALVLRRLLDDAERSDSSVRSWSRSWAARSNCWAWIDSCF